ncbi:hypothetical protein CDAR_282861 [Caerostris darwini]|uniref:Uncharacterized protein n=1 Tax=Caerostris darwini TaxID=1538125 RepID=A0AAV4W9W8_9ARAC|nr:hypothetical protein CDAR_282861 [Caerostris darwini]
MCSDCFNNTWLVPSTGRREMNRPDYSLQPSGQTAGLRQNSIMGFTCINRRYQWSGLITRQRNEGSSDKYSQINRRVMQLDSKSQGLSTQKRTVYSFNMGLD